MSLSTNTASGYKFGTTEYLHARMQDLRNDSTNAYTHYQLTRNNVPNPNLSSKERVEFFQEQLACDEKILVIGPCFYNVLGTGLTTGLAACSASGPVGPGWMLGISTLVLLGNCCCLKFSIRNSCVSEKTRNALLRVHLASTSINACMWIVNLVALSVLASKRKR